MAQFCVLSFLFNFYWTSQKGRFDYCLHLNLIFMYAFHLKLNCFEFANVKAGVYKKMAFILVWILWFIFRTCLEFYLFTIIQDLIFKILIQIMTLFWSTLNIKLTWDQQKTTKPDISQNKCEYKHLMSTTHVYIFWPLVIEGWNPLQKIALKFNLRLDSPS